jgi:hypothetical protein
VRRSPEGRCQPEGVHGYWCAWRRDRVVAQVVSGAPISVRSEARDSRELLPECSPARLAHLAARSDRYRSGTEDRVGHHGLLGRPSRNGHPFPYDVNAVMALAGAVEDLRLVAIVSATPKLDRGDRRLPARAIGVHMMEFDEPPRSTPMSVRGDEGAAPEVPGACPGRARSCRVSPRWR